MKWRKLLPLFALGALLLCLSGLITAGTTHAATPSDDALKKQAQSNAACSEARLGASDNNTNIACYSGYIWGYKGAPPLASACGDNAMPIIYQYACKAGYSAGQAARKAVDAAATVPKNKTLNTNEIEKLGTTSTTCAGKNPNNNGGGAVQAYEGCITGYVAGYKGSPSVDVTCDKKKVTLPKDCKDGYAAGVADKKSNVKSAGDQTSANNPAVNTSEESSDSTEDNCSGVFGWAICELLRESEKAVGWVEDNFIVPFYTTDPLRLDCASISASQRASTEGCAEYNVWVAIRNLSNIFFVLIFLAFIFANTLSFNLDSYAVKKMLPKLIAAVIIVQFSYLFMAFAIDITNVLGRGIGGIVNSAIPDNLQFNVGVDQAAVGLGVSAAVGGAVAVGLATAFASGSVWVIVALAFIAIIGVFFTLIFRQMLIVMLVISAPIAIACLVLPNTEKVYKLWLNTLIKVLLMYPLIMLIFSSSKLLSLAAAINGGAFASVIRLVVTVLPLFAIPFTFKWAGGLMNAGATAIQKRSAGYGKKVNDSEWAKERRTQAGIEKRSLAAGTGISVMGRNVGSGGVGRFLGRANTLDRGGVRAQSKLNADRGVFDKQFETAGLAGEDLNMAIGGRQYRDEMLSRARARNAQDTTFDLDAATAKINGSYEKTKAYHGNKVAAQAAALRLADKGAVTHDTRIAMGQVFGTAPGGAGEKLWKEVGRKASDKQLELGSMSFGTGTIDTAKLQAATAGKTSKELAKQGANFHRVVATASANGHSVVDPTVLTQLQTPGKLSPQKTKFYETMQNPAAATPEDVWDAGTYGGHDTDAPHNRDIEFS